MNASPWLPLVLSFAAWVAGLFAPWAFAYAGLATTYSSKHPGLQQTVSKRGHISTIDILTQPTVFNCQMLIWLKTPFSPF
jgi:hypothetical protein